MSRKRGIKSSSRDLDGRDLPMNDEAVKLSGAHTRERGTHGGVFNKEQCRVVLPRGMDSSVDKREGTYRRAGATLEFEGDTEELELAEAN